MSDAAGVINHQPRVGPFSGLALGFLFMTSTPIYIEREWVDVHIRQPTSASVENAWRATLRRCVGAQISVGGGGGFPFFGRPYRRGKYLTKDLAIESPLSPRVEYHRLRPRKNGAPTEPIHYPHLFGRASSGPEGRQLIAGGRWWSEGRAEPPVCVSSDLASRRGASAAIRESPLPQEKGSGPRSTGHHDQKVPSKATLLPPPGGGLVCRRNRWLRSSLAPPPANSYRPSGAKRRTPGRSWKALRHGTKRCG